jgi:hypothetical protein
VPRPVEVEATWLNADPAVSAALTVLPYWRRSAANTKTAHLRRTRTTDTRVAIQRREQTHEFELAIRWPVTSAATGNLETAQGKLDDAIDAVLARIKGPLTDFHTHGGAFLSVGEEDAGGQGLRVTYADPEMTVGPNGQGELRAVIQYAATSHEIGQ